MTSGPVDMQALTRAMNEVLILAVLRREALHGYQIALEVERRSGGLFGFQHGTLYPILHRLEADGRIAGTWEKDEGRRRKVYALTASGRRQLRGGAARLAEILETLRGMTGVSEHESLPDAS